MSIMEIHGMLVESVYAQGKLLVTEIIQDRSKSLDRTHLLQAQFVADRINDQDQKNILRSAFAQGFREGFFELANADIENLTWLLSSIKHTAKDWPEINLFIESAFSATDIEQISKIYMDHDGALVNHHGNSFGRFLHYISKPDGGGDPFKNLRNSVPLKHFENYLPNCWTFDQCSIIEFAACCPEFESLISEEFFKAALEDSLSEKRVGSQFWNRLQGSDHFKRLFEKHMPDLFRERVSYAVDFKSYYDVTRITKALSESGLLDKVASVRNILKLTQGMLEQNPRLYCEIFTAAVEIDKFKKCFSLKKIQKAVASMSPMDCFRNEQTAINTLNVLDGVLDASAKAGFNGEILSKAFAPAP